MAVTAQAGPTGEPPPVEQQDLSTWATELAAALPPLTQSQATAVGRVATQLDARIGDEQAA